MKYTQKDFANIKMEQSLQTIRSRMTHLQNSRKINNQQTQVNSNYNTFEKPTVKSINFMGRLKSLQGECEVLLSTVKESILSQKALKTNFINMKQDLIRDCERIQTHNFESINILGAAVKAQILSTSDRRQNLQNHHQINVQGMNKVKVELAEIRNRITEIQHILGISGHIKQNI